MAITTTQPFQTTFAVPLHCDNCVQAVSKAVNELEGISQVKADLDKQLIFIEGTTAPSSIVNAIESTGRDAILRGSGASNSAGVCILETHAKVADPVKGLARMVQIGKDVTLVDLTLNGLSPGIYHASVREAGDISKGAASTGGIWEAVKSLTEWQHARGSFGTIEVGKDGRGAAFINKPFSVWEVIGRSMVVSRTAPTKTMENDADTLVGVIARSAGVWDNDKTVCSCSGKTVWEERKEQKAKGVL